MAFRRAFQLFAQGAGGARRRRAEADALWGYSESYVEIAEEGTQRPPPSFGSPAVAWHIGIWPKASAELSLDVNALPKRVERYEENNERFFTDLSNFLAALQKRGRIDGSPVQVLDLTPRPLADKRVHSFKVCQPQSLTFTLWWQDQAGQGRLNERQAKPSPDDLRVRVQAQTHLDHATVSFFVDAARPRGSRRVLSSKSATGARRTKIFEHAERTKAICDRQMRTGAVNFDRLPEREVSASDAAALRAAADYCYSELWDEFVAAFGFGSVVAADGAPEDRIGEVFASFRTLILAVKGASAQSTLIDESGPTSEDAEVRAGTIGSGRFPTFDNESGEPNTVLKAYWPFMRRMTPGADDREFIACGVFDWRALYIAPLGLKAQSFERDEVDDLTAIIPGGAVPEPGDPRTPIRQLFFTRGEPNRQQIGRIVERINAIGTMRMFTLRNWGTIQNAGIYIRLIGEQLDGILSNWSKERKRIEERHPALRARNVAWFGGRLPIPGANQQADVDARVDELTRLINATEAQLIAIGAVLDEEIGQGGSGRLLYVINRSKLFIGEFERLLETLKIGNVETWVTYPQFVDRGLAPVFVSTERIGARLISLRERLQSVTAMVQTGALIVQTEATSNNTQTLRRIATNANALQIGVLGIVVGLIVQIYKDEDRSKVANVIDSLSGPVNTLVRETPVIRDFLPSVPSADTFLPTSAGILTFLFALAALLVIWTTVRFLWAALERVVGVLRRLWRLRYGLWRFFFGDPRNRR